MKTTLLKTTLSLLATAALTLPAAADTLIVNWGGNYYTNSSTTDMNILDNYSGRETIPGGVLLPYSETVKKSPVNSNYDNAGSSAIFYGAIQLTSQSGNPAGAQVRIQRNDDQNHIRISTSTGTSSNHTYAQGLIFWKKDGFLNGFADKSSLSLGNLQELTLDITNARSTRNTAIRFAIQNNGTWYLSETALSGIYWSEAPGELMLSDPASINWGEWDPANSPLNVGPSSFDIAGTTLNDITAVGFYFDGTYTANSSASFDFKSFSVVGIPEPSTAALLGAPVLLLMAYKLKRRK